MTMVIRTLKDNIHPHRLYPVCTTTTTTTIDSRPPAHSAPRLTHPVRAAQLNPHQPSSSIPVNLRNIRPRGRFLPHERFWIWGWHGQAPARIAEPARRRLGASPAHTGIAYEHRPPRDRPGRCDRDRRQADPR